MCHGGRDVGESRYHVSQHCLSSMDMTARHTNRSAPSSGESPPEPGNVGGIAGSWFSPKWISAASILRAVIGVDKAKNDNSRPAVTLPAERHLKKRLLSEGIVYMNMGCRCRSRVKSATTEAFSDV